MCMKYENLYGDCFDYLFTSNDLGGIVDLLRIRYRIEIIDMRTFKFEILSAFARAHEVGAIRPVVEPQLIS